MNQSVIIRKFQELTKSSSNPVQDLARWLCRKVLDILPGATGQEKANWVENSLKEAVDLMSEEARKIFGWGLMAPLGEAISLSIREAGYAGIQWLMDNYLSAFIKNAYLLELFDPESPVVSSSASAIFPALQGA